MKRAVSLLAVVLFATTMTGPSALRASGRAGVMNPITFSVGQNIPVGRAFGVTTADFNGDGHLDLAATNGVFSGIGVEVFLGAGDGTFGSGTLYPTGVCATPVTASDLNLDGNIDLLVANYCSATRTIVVWWGNGDGTFGSRSDYSIPGGAQAVAVGDFNGDGWPDIATNSSNGTPSILTGYLNDGSGGFGSRFDLAISNNPFCWGHGMVSRDFNEDGLDDIAVSAGYDGTGVFLASASGGFDPVVIYPYGSYGLAGLAAADFNGDGHVDLIAYDHVLLGAGNGTFSPAPGTAVGSDEVETGDFNLDGRSDIVVAHEYAARVDAAVGRGDGTFEAASGTIVSNTSIESIVGDFNEDGRPDVATTLNFSSVQILLNTTPPADVTPPEINCETPDGVWHAMDVTLACTATDTETGLAFSGDATFTLSTAVAAGDETANAATGTRTVCDAVNNCATAGPIVGNMIDRKAPIVAIVTPSAATYTLNEAVPSNYGCGDGGSGTVVCQGPVDVGAAIDTASTGTKAFLVTAQDAVGNASAASVFYSVSLGGQFTSGGPTTAWIGLKNSDDVGTRFDIRAEVLRNGVVVGSGQLDAVTGGSSGFNNAVERAIGSALAGPTTIGPGESLSVTLLVRIAVGVSGHRSGTARLWYNDAAADSRIGTVVNGVARTFYLVDGFVLTTAPGSGPKRTVDVLIDRAAGGNPFKPFGTWTIVF